MSARLPSLLALCVLLAAGAASAQSDPAEGTAPRPSRAAKAEEDACGDPDVNEQGAAVDPAAQEARQLRAVDAGAAVSDGSATAEDSEISGWKSTAERYRLRADEFASEVSRLVRARYDAEAAELAEGYDRLVGRADLEERALRDEAIAAHELFVREHKESAHTARRMFRLAELYFEESEEKFLIDIEKYAELEDLFDKGKVDFLPEPPLKDYRKSIALYKRIITDFPAYGDIGAVYYMLGYCYSDPTARHLDAERARETYTSLVDNVPDSTYAPQALFRLGNIAFEENQLPTAIRYYRQILDQFEARSVDEPWYKWEASDQRLFEGSLYKFAWAYYKLDRPDYPDLETAITEFTKLLDWAEAKFARTNQVADLRPETIRYVAISFSDLAGELGRSPMGYALSWLDQLGDRPWKFDVLAQLATVLQEQAQFEEAIDAYLGLQQSFPLHPQAPEFQNEVVKLYNNLAVPDPDAAADARVSLAEAYGPTSAWSKANEENKEALTKANDYILASLEWVAISYHNRAFETGDPADYLLAAEKYREYLETYPFAKNAYDLSFWLAECLFYAERWEDAIAQYERLSGFPEDHRRRETLEAVVAAYRELWLAQGTVEAEPGALANLKPALGEQVEYKTLPFNDLEKDYVAAVRELLEFDPNYEQAVVILYDLGQIHYYKNWLPQAREIFERIIEGWPQTNFASFSAGLIVDSYTYTGQLVKMRQAATRFAAMGLGEPGSELAAERELTFASLERQGLFKQGEMAYNSGRFDCAVEAFEDYFARYGDEGTEEDPQNIDLVLYNVAQAYSKLGKTEESNRWFEMLLERFPRSEQAPATFWKMASNYERILELDKAVRYYEELVQFHPGHEDTASALYNAAFLKVGTGRFAEAARDYERYHTMFPDEKDAKDIFFRAAEMWEAAEDRRSATRVYDEWLEIYGAEDPDRWVETKYKLAGFAREAGKDRKADEILQLIDQSYEALRSQLSGLGVKISAEIRFKPLREEFEEYASVKFSGDAEKDAPVFQRRIEWNKELAQKFDAFVTEYLDFEWQTAALYYKGMSYKVHADGWANYPIPKDVLDDPELLDIFQQKLDQQSEPMFKLAESNFKTIYDQAKQKKRHTKWVDEALVQLAAMYPGAYAVPKPERSKVIESDAWEVPPPAEAPDGQSALPRAGAVRYAVREAR